MAETPPEREFRRGLLILIVHLPLRSVPRVLRAPLAPVRTPSAHGQRTLSLLRSRPDEVQKSSVATGPSITAALARQNRKGPPRRQGFSLPKPDLECRTPVAPHLARSNRETDCLVYYTPDHWKVFSPWPKMSARVRVIVFLIIRRPGMGVVVSPGIAPDVSR